MLFYAVPAEGRAEHFESSSEGPEATSRNMLKTHQEENKIECRWRDTGGAIRYLDNI